MSVRAGWPLRTLAAVVVGYVAAFAVVPPDGVRVPSEPDATGSTQLVEAPLPLVPMDDRAPFAGTAVSVPPTDLDTPPPLRGGREPVASAEEVDRILVTAAERDRVRATLDRWYRRLDPAVPAAAR